MIESTTAVTGAVNLLSTAIENIRIAIETGNASYPVATIAYAQTIDGSIAPITKSRMHLSSKTSFKLLHSLRKFHDAVLVGINTVVIDDPLLNVRETLPGIGVPQNEDQPRAVILDSQLRFLNMSQNLRVNRPIIVTTIESNDEKFTAANNRIRSIGGTVLSVRKSISGHCDIIDTFLSLRSIGVKSVLVEGGAQILQSVLENNLCRQVSITIRPCFLGGYRSLTSQLPHLIELENIKLSIVEGDIVLLGDVVDSCNRLNSGVRNAVDVAALSNFESDFIRSSIEVV